MGAGLQSLVHDSASPYRAGMYVHSNSSSEMPVPRPSEEILQNRIFLLYADGRVSRMTIHINDAGLNPPRIQSMLKKAFGRNRIPIRRQQKLDCVSARVNGTV